MSRCADCPFCGKSEQDECSACGGVNAIAGADKKRRARDSAERAGDGRNAPTPSVDQSPATGKPAPRGGV